MTVKMYRYINVLDSICLEEWYVVRKTPRGCWVRPDYWVPSTYKDKFILDASQKKFVWPTLSEAQISFIRRKLRQQSLLKSQLEVVEHLLEMHDSGNYPNKPGQYVNYPGGFASTSINF